VTIAPDRVRAQLLHLTGPDGGRTITYDKPRLLLGSAPDADIRYTEGLTVKPRHAVMTLEGRCDFHLKALEGEVFVNHREVEEVVLRSGDLVELGRMGPKMRFRVHAGAGRPCKPVTQMLADAREVGGLSGIYRSSISLGRDLVRHTSWPMRIGGLAALLVVVFGLAYFGGHLAGRSSADEDAERYGRELERLREEQAERERELQRQIEAFRAELEKSRAAAMASQEERERLRRKLDRIEGASAQRDENLKRIFDEYSKGVCLVHGIYTLLRTVKGKRVPLRDTDGDPVQIEYVGSGFLASRGGHVLTNRHVAEPWWGDRRIAMLLKAGFEPVFTRLDASFPGKTPVHVDPKTIAISKEGVDIAVLRVKVEGVPVLPLFEGDPRDLRGKRVLVIGYPTGVNALLARSEPDFVREVMDKASNMTELIAELAARNAVSPLITQGGLNDVRERRLVYDALTTSGGSGGPVFASNGTVVGVNFAVTRDFAGSNFGVPIRFARALLN